MKYSPCRGRFKESPISASIARIAAPGERGTNVDILWFAEIAATVAIHLRLGTLYMFTARKNAETKTKDLANTLGGRPVSAPGRAAG